MRKILGGLLGGFLILGITGCGDNSRKELSVVEDLNQLHASCLKENESSTCNMNWTLQEYLKTYSSYQLLNASNKEFSVKPAEPNSLFTYGTSRDALCNYQYALFYNKDTNRYYSVEFSCENNTPTFKKSTLLK